MQTKEIISHSWEKALGQELSTILKDKYKQIEKLR